MISVKKLNRSPGVMAGLFLLAMGAGSVGTAVAAAEPDIATDERGFVNSTARCISPDRLVVFGNTEESRVAICQTPSGQLEYRGVRISDGAKLVAPAAQDRRSGAFIAEDQGNIYTVTSRALTHTRGNHTISHEAMLNFYQPGTGGADREHSPS